MPDGQFLPQLDARPRQTITERVNLMNRLAVLVALTIALAAFQSAEAQVYQVYYAAPSTAYYQPAPVTTTYYAPTTTYYSPATTYYTPSPTYYYAPAAPVTYYRPILGGGITGWRYNYAPVTYAYPGTVTYYRGW
jgi:hypothetical protein